MTCKLTAAQGMILVFARHPDSFFFPLRYNENIRGSSSVAQQDGSRNTFLNVGRTFRVTERAGVLLGNFKVLQVKHTDVIMLTMQ